MHLVVSVYYWCIADTLSILDVLNQLEISI